jgi:hypothetical protein
MGIHFLSPDAIDQFSFFCVFQLVDTHKGHVDHGDTAFSSGSRQLSPTKTFEYGKNFAFYGRIERDCRIECGQHW